jgi:DNA-binding MarR family transcriptional regulator
MLKKLHVLAEALRRRTFTVAELAKACQLSESTVHTVLQRTPQDWFSSRVIAAGSPGGQPRHYQLTEAGEAAIRESIGRLPSATPLAPIQVPADAPIGLLAARAALERLKTADAELAAVLRKEASENLDWAEAELDDGGFAPAARVLRDELSALRTKLGQQPLVSSTSARDEPRFESVARVAMARGPQRDPTTPSLPQALAGALRRLAQLSQSSSWDQWAVQRVTPNQRKTLELLAHSGESLSLSAVARELSVTAATACDVVSALETKRLVRKQRSTTDSRVLALVLTDEGEALANQLRSLPDPLWGAFDVLAENEQETLYRLSIKMIRGLQENGALPTSRMCLRCKFFEPFRYSGSATPHHCHSMKMPFAEKQLRIDCSVFELADPKTQQSLWERFTAHESEEPPAPPRPAEPERRPVPRLEVEHVWLPLDPDSAELLRELHAAQAKVAELEEKLGERGQF